MKMAFTFSKFKNLMKRVILCLILGLGFHFSALAQPSILISNANPNVGDTNIPITVEVVDFTQLLSVEFTLRWDPTVIALQNVNIPGNLVDLDIGDFDTSNSAAGFLTMQWYRNENPNACDDINAEGVDLPDFTQIFSLTFDAVGDYGACTDIFLDNDPVPIRVTRKFTPVTSCNNIQINTDNSPPGKVSLGVRPFNISASNETVNTGDVVCVDFSVTGWDDLTGAQFTVGWDQTALSLNQVVPSEDITNLSLGNFNTNIPGCLPVSWFYSVPSGDGISVDDNTVMFTACFDVLMDCEMSTVVGFKSEPTPPEIKNVIVDNFNVTFIPNEGNVTTNDCLPTGLQLTTDCDGPYELNDQFCVPVRAGSNFTDVSDLAFQMKWNPAILEYDAGADPMPNAVFTGAGLQFNTSNTENGVLAVSWESPIAILNADLNDGDKLFDVCFTVVGIAGDSPFSIPTTQDTVRIDNGSNIGVNPTNCLIDITPPDGVILNINGGQAPLGENFCTDITVNNFTEITDFQFSLNWDITNFSLTSVTPVNLPGASVIDLGPTGIVAIDWSSGGTPLTLNDGDVVATLCFDAVGPPLSCDQASLTDIPLESEAISSTSNGNNIGVTAQVADWCIQSPNGFFLNIASGNIARDDTLCIPVTVASYDDILSTSFCINYDNVGLEFIELGTTFEVPGIDGSNGTISVQPGVGLVCVDFIDLSGTGVSAPDGSIMMELCFNAIGDANTCEPLDVNNSLEVETLAGAGSVIATGGEICIDDKIELTDVRIFDATCPGDTDGRIEIEFEGGSNNGQGVVFNWPGLDPVQFGDTIQNLAPGNYTVEYFDAQNPNVSGTATFTVGVRPGAPVADAGLDQERVCCPMFNILSAAGSSQGDDFDYSWFFGSVDQDGNVQEGTFGGTNLNFVPNCEQVSDSSAFILLVTNVVTQCEARDTVFILPAEIPTANAGLDQPFTCDDSAITFTGSGSTPSGGSVSFMWDLEGGSIEPEMGQDLTAASINVTGMSGNAIFTVTNDANSCTAVDTVVILEQGGFPDANAGSDKVIGCTGTVTLDASSSNNEGSDVSYVWQLIPGGPSFQGETVETTTIGMYELVATNNSTNCVTRDTVEVIADTDVPIVELETGMEGMNYNCTNLADTLSLAATLSNVANFNFTWETADGSFVSGTTNTLTPQITSGGIYNITVTNVENNCEATAMIEVVTDTLTPLAEASLDSDTLILNCAVTSFTLDGMGSSTQDVSYTWADTSMVIPGDAIEVSEMGTYYLTVENTINGCFAIDSVVVDTNFLTPVISVATPPSISCASDSVILVAAVEDIEGTLNIAWSTGNGGPIENADQLEATVDQIGDYTVTVTLEESGCSVQEMVNVEADDTVPMAVISSPNSELTCDNGVANLDGANSSTGDRFVYAWTVVSPDGQLPPDTSQINTFTSSPGIYQLMVTDTILGCSATDVIEVTIDVELPPVSVGANGEITCTNLEHTFNTSQTAMGPQYTYEWHEVIDDSTTAFITVDINNVFTEPGTYVLFVTDTENGCVGADFGSVVDIRTDAPEIVADAPLGDELTCIIEEVTFQASVSPDTVDYTYQWFDAMDNPLAGETDTILTVMTPGDYYMIATNVINECTGQVDVTALNDQVPPVASFPQDTFFLTCLIDSIGIQTTGTSMGDNIDYVWNQIAAGQGQGTIPGISTELEFGAPFVGTFEFVVTNMDNGCVDVDTAYIATNYEAPDPIIGPTGEFNCQIENITLDGSLSTFEGTPTIEWFSLGAGEIIGNSLQANIDSAGGYQLTIITNPLIDECRASTNIFVEGNFEEPEIMVEPVDSFDCFTPFVALSASGTANGDFETSWENVTTGDITSGFTASAQNPGSYIFTMTTNANIEECTARDTVEVGISAEEPELEFTATDPLTCVLEEVPISITNVDISIVQNTVWDGPGIGTEFPLSAILNECGEYTATTTIMNDIIGDCEAVGTFVIECDTMAPVITISAFEPLACNNMDETLDISGSTIDADATITWMLDMMEIPGTSGMTMITASEAGEYTVTVNDPSNGCEDDEVIALTGNFDAPAVILEPFEDFDCSMEPVTLDASGSGDPGSFETIEWSAVGGGSAPSPANSLVTDAPSGGDYQLFLVNADNGCDTTIMITVEEDMELPTSEATDPNEDNQIGCLDFTANIGGPNTSQGTEFEYQWSVVSGSATVTNPTDAQTNVDGAGTFELLVTNTSNNCTSTSSVTVEAVVDLDDASLQPDTTICEEDYILTANLPTGAEGTWTTSSGAEILDPTDPASSVMGLETGDNIFTWTLTAPNCPDYSTASVVITVPSGPTAFNDIATVPEDVDAITISTLNNDMPGNNFNYTITTDPLLGQVDSIDAANGIIFYSIKPGQFGATSLVYKICDEDCVTLCDEATVNIEIERRTIDVKNPNGITMNDDGVNDALVFFQLENNPEAYENNELIIFNRWGDIVYEAAPYNNDWKGTNTDGNELPEGTYYYILRLSIPTGEIIRGDVTIVK